MCASWCMVQRGLRMGLYAFLFFSFLRLLWQRISLALSGSDHCDSLYPRVVEK